MSKEKKEITTLKYGELHIYYPLVLETKLSLAELCNTIYNSAAAYNDDYQQRVRDTLGSSLADTVQQLQDSIPNPNTENSPVSFNVYDSNSNKLYCPSTDSRVSKHENTINNLDLRIEVYSDNPSSIKLNVVNTEFEAMQFQIMKMEREYNTSKEIYGESFTSSHNRILLVPFKASLNNGNSVWINSVLLVFSNNMAILKVELPLIDIKTSFFKENKIDSLVTCINNVCILPSDSLPHMLSDLPNYYFNIIKSTQIKIYRYNHELKNIIFVDYDNIPDRVNSISPDLQEDIFRIVCAPVPNYPFMSFSSQAHEYYEKYTCGQNGMKYIIKTTGGVLSLSDKGFRDYCFNHFKETYSLSTLSGGSYYLSCSEMAGTLNMNIEFAIIMVMLKKLNESSTIYNKTHYHGNLSSVQKKYNQNLLYINQLQNNCYGTVYEQTEQLEKMMPHYLKPIINKSSQSALDNIIKDEEQNNKTRYYNFLSSCSLILSIVFGLPSIHEALVILHNSFWPQKLNIPYITIDNTSIVLWIILNLIVLSMVIRDEKKCN